MFARLLLHILVKKMKIILKVPPNYNKNWSVNINLFVILGHFDALHWEKKNARNTGKEEYTNAHLLVSAKDHELRGKNSAYYSHKTNILDLQLRVGSWNYMSASKQMKHSLPEIMHNSWKRVHKIWYQSLKLFQNGGNFQLPHVNFTRTGSNKVN